MDLQTEIKLLSMNLDIGQSSRSFCPECNRYTFSITRMANTIAYNCYRDSCTLKSGYIDHNASQPTKAAPRKALKPYTGPLQLLDEEDFDYFRRRFRLEPSILVPNVRKDVDTDRYMLSINDPWGYTRGHIARLPCWGIKVPCPLNWERHEGEAKAITYRHAEGPVQSFYTAVQSIDFSGPAPTVLVEDQISAMCVAQAGYNAVALLGTHLNESKVKEIVEFSRHNEVLIALDADATKTSFNLARKWGLAFKATRVVILERDLKEEIEVDIKRILG